MKQLSALLTALIATAASSTASAQAIVYETYSPVVVSGPAVVSSPVVAASPVVVQSPVVYEAWRPAATTYNPPVSSPTFTGYRSNYGATTSYYAPVTTYSPVVTTYSPVVTSAYSPVVTTYSPVVATAPVVTTYYTPVVVRPRFVPGEPVRNFFRSFGR